MNIFQRLQDLVTSNTHHAIDLAEDPEKMLKQAIREMDENIRTGRSAVVAAVSSEKKLACQLQQHRGKASELATKTESAVESGNDELAWSLLERKLEHESIATELEQSWTCAKSTCENLKAQLDRLINKRGELSRKRDSLALRQRAAEARTAVCRSMAGAQIPEGAEDKFIRMQDRVSELEAESLAVSEVFDEHNDPELKAKQLDSDARVKAELNALKERIQQRQQAKGRINMT